MECACECLWIPFGISLKSIKGRMPLVDTEIYRFDHSFSIQLNVSSCAGTDVSLTPKAFDTLLCLVRNQGRLVTKDELLRQVWPDTFVEEINLAVNISTIRKALGESAKESRFIVTVPGHGYRFVANLHNPYKNGNGKWPDIGENSPAHEASEDHEIRSEFGDTPVDISAKRRPLRLAVLATLTLLIAATSVSYFLLRGKSTKASTPGDASIAVLPFADLSPGQDQGYFTDGLADELINDLAQVPRLKVVARSSAFEFRNRNEDVRSVGHKLGVSNILEGSVRKERDRFRISVELANTQSGFQI